jgi:hypothetical protein
MPWVKGQSGNPAGRARIVVGFRDRCRLWADKEGWTVLQEIAAERHGRDRMRAVELLFAYGYGRPVQPMSGDVDPEAAPLRVTVVFDKPDAEQG